MLNLNIIKGQLNIFSFGSAFCSDTNQVEVAAGKWKIAHYVEI